MKHPITDLVLNVKFVVDNSQIIKIKDEINRKFDNLYDTEPHITLVTLLYLYSNFLEIKPYLEKYLHNLNPFEIKFEEVTLKRSTNYLSIKVNTEELIKIHQQLLQIILPKWNNVLKEVDIQRLNNNEYTHEEKDSLLKYGFRYSGEYFFPHISIGRITNDDVNFDNLFNEVKQKLDKVLGSKYIVDKLSLSIGKYSEKHSKTESIYMKEFILTCN